MLFQRLPKDPRTTARRSPAGGCPYGRTVPPSARRPRACPSSLPASLPEFYPEFLANAGAALCPHNDLACVQTIIVPSMAEQLRVLFDFQDVQLQVSDMRGLDPVFFKLIMAHKTDAVRALVAALGEMDAVDERIRDLIDGAKLLDHAFTLNADRV